MPKSENREQRHQRPPLPKPPAASVSAPVGPRRSTFGSIVQWFLSHRVRQATAMRKHVQKLLNHQRDILSPQAVQAIQAAVAELQHALESSDNTATLETQMENLEAVANKWLKPYPNAAWREN